MKRLAPVLVGPLLLLPLAVPHAAAQSVEPGFTIEEVADVPGPTALAFPPPGSVYGTDLLVASYFDNSPMPDLIGRIAPDGDVTTFAVLLAEADPVALEFPPAGSPFGDLLYVSSNNRDFNQPLDCGGVIQTVDAAGSWSDYTGLSGCVSCAGNSGAGAGLGEPTGIAFGRGGAFGWDIFVSNSTDVPASVMRVGLGGVTSIHADDGINSCQVLAGHLLPVGAEFGPGGAFGTDLFISDYDPACECVRTVDAAGVISPSFASIPEGPAALEFGPLNPGHPFGDSLFVAAQTGIYRVRPDGSVSSLASGFVRFSADALEFAPDASSLYVADYGGDKVYRIRPLQQAGGPLLRSVTKKPRRR